MLARDRENGAKEQYEKDSGKLRGYWECLEQMEVLKNFEMKSLYLCFFLKAEDNYTTHPAGLRREKEGKI